MTGMARVTHMVLAVRTALAGAMLVALVTLTGCGGHRASRPPVPKGVVPGPLVTSWGAGGTLTLQNVAVAQLFEDGVGRIVAAGIASQSRAYVARLRADGSLDPTFGSGGAVRWPYARHLGWLMGAALPDGRIALAGATEFGVVNDHSALVVTVLDAKGSVDRTFGRNGYVVMDGKSCLRGPAGMAVDGDKLVVTALRWCNSNARQSPVVLRFGRNGAADDSFGEHGTVKLPSYPADVVPFAPVVVLPNERLVVASYDGTAARVLLIGLDRNGRTDPSFETTPTAVGGIFGHGIEALFRAKLGRFTISGCGAEGPFLARFNRDGSAYRFWGGGAQGARVNVESFGGAFGARCAAFAQLPNFRLVAAGTALVHLYPTGVLDPHHPLATLPAFRPAAQDPAHVVLAGSDRSIYVTSYLIQSRQHRKTLITRYR